MFSLIVLSITPTVGAIVLLKSDSSDDHIFLTLLRYSFEILSLFIGPLYSMFYQFPNAYNYHLQSLIEWWRC